jgi:repressor LexA
MHFSKVTKRDPKQKHSTFSLTKMSPRYTPLQGQYLAFIYYYAKIHACAPAEADMQAYFKVSPPSINQMVLTLERNRLITRKPGEPRSIRLAVAREDLPDLE